MAPLAQLNLVQKLVPKGDEELLSVSLLVLQQHLMAFLPQLQDSLLVFSIDQEAYVVGKDSSDGMREALHESHVAKAVLVADSADVLGYN